MPPPSPARRKADIFTAWERLLMKGTEKGCVR